MSDYGAEYFQKRGLENKHFWMANAWLHYFGHNASFICLGDGRMHHTFALDYYGADVMGCDVSEWSVAHCSYENLKEKIFIADISKDDLLSKTNGRTFNVVVAFDVLEHVNTIEGVKFALNQCYNLSNKFLLVSVPWIGNPCLEADVTHHIKKSREWWIWAIRSASFEIIETPVYFPYGNQIILGVKK